jgi:hypothetical protein
MFFPARHYCENSAIGSVTRRAPTPDMVNAPVMEQYALVLSKVRRQLTTFNLQRPRFDLRDDNPVRKLRSEDGKRIYRLKFKLRRHSLVTNKIERSIHARGCRSCRRR